MTKHFLTFLFLLAVLAGFSQSVPIIWSVSSQKQESNHYLIAIKALAEKSWYVYAKDDTANQITTISISWDNSHIVKSSELKKTNSPETIHDKIFGNKPFRVYSNSFQFIQFVQIDGSIPPILKITIHGFAANGKEFRPIDETRQIVFDGGINNQAGLASQIKLKTVDLQNPQPLYVILNLDEQLMNLPVGYTPDPKVYEQWLKCGRQAGKESIN